MMKLRSFTPGAPPDIAGQTSGQTRYAIVTASTVVSIVTLPNGTLPTLTTGQTSIASLTLKIGDHVP